MTYRTLLEFLKRRGNEVQGVHLGLQRMRAMMKALGHPERKMVVLHVAGTNGKGSVAATAESVLRLNGSKTGLYTSPHLVHLEERIRVNGREISRQELADAASLIRRVENGLSRQRVLDRPLTYFEFITACAFLHFARRGVEVGVIEVGLGGALDATNVVNPSVCVVTGVSYDHQDLLGNSLEEIAREKAGIIKPAVLVISGCRSGAARRVVRETAANAAAPLLEIDRDCRFCAVGEYKGRFTIDLQTPRRHYGKLRLSLAGKHQIRNAALAVTAVEALPGVSIGIRAVRAGVAATRWPGRMEEYGTQPRVLLDGAHNPDGARLLADHLGRFGPPRLHMVFGVMRDKDIRKIGNALFPLAQDIYLTPIHNQRSATPEEIIAVHPRFRTRMRIYPSSSKALQAALQECPRRGLVVVTGSLYLLGEILPALRRLAR